MIIPTISETGSDVCTEINASAGYITAYESNVLPFTCALSTYDMANNVTYVNGSYNQAATLFFGTGIYVHR